MLNLKMALFSFDPVNFEMTGIFLLKYSRNRSSGDFTRTLYQNFWGVFYLDSTLFMCSSLIWIDKWWEFFKISWFLTHCWPTVSLPLRQTFGFLASLSSNDYRSFIKILWFRLRNPNHDFSYVPYIQPQTRVGFGINVCNASKTFYCSLRTH